jgi:mannosyltransferase
VVNTDATRENVSTDLAVVRPPSALIRRFVLTSWFLPASLTAAIGLLLIGRPVLWQDELVTVNVASRSTSQILSLLGRVDAVHGAYYLFMHGWIQLFGDSPVAVRVPSALAMAGAAACVALCAEHLYDRTTGLLAGLVFAVVPSTVRFAQETRSYAFVVLAAALSTLLLLRALDRPSVARWTGYGLTLTMIAYLNAVAAAMVAGHLVGLAVYWRRSGNRRTAVSFVVTVVGGLALAVPVLRLGSQQADTQVEWVAHAPFWVVWQQTASSRLVAWALVVLGLLAWLRERRATGFATAVALTPLVVVWLASLGQLSYFFPKYLLFTLPAWAVLAGAGLAALRLRVVMAATLVVLVALALPGQYDVHHRLGHSWYTYPEPRDGDPPDYAAAARVIADGYHPGDGVVYSRAWWWKMPDIGVEYYLPAQVRPHDMFLLRAASDRGDLYAEDACKSSTTCAADPFAVLAAAPQTRLWIVVPFVVSDPLEQFFQPESLALHGYYRTGQITHVSGMTLELMTRVGS